MKLKQIFSRDMTILVLGQVISLFGNAIVRFALPLYLLRETNSPSLFGVVTACSFLPMVVFSFLGGGIADRVNKRNIMVALDFATSLLMVGLALALEVLPLSRKTGFLPCFSNPRSVCGLLPSPSQK